MYSNFLSTCDVFELWPQGNLYALRGEIELELWQRCVHEIQPWCLPNLCLQACSSFAQTGVHVEPHGEVLLAPDAHDEALKQVGTQGSFSAIV